MQGHSLSSSMTYPGIGVWHRHLAKAEHGKLYNYKYLWPIRGGFGSVFWSDFLLNASNHEAPYLIGFSDISVWHNIWHIKSWGETAYAFMPGTLWGEKAETSLDYCLKGESFEVNQDHYPDVVVLRSGEAEGPCFASCLRVLASTIGTACQVSLEGHILALEDIDERPYSVERDMQQLHRSGVLEGVKALVIGTMPCELPDQYAGPSMQDIFKAWGELLQIPVIQALPFGHVDDPLSLPISRQSQLKADASGWSWQFAAR